LLILSVAGCLLYLAVNWSCSRSPRRREPFNHSTPESLEASSMEALYVVVWMGLFLLLCLSLSLVPRAIIRLSSWFEGRSPSWVRCKGTETQRRCLKTLALTSYEPAPLLPSPHARILWTIGRSGPGYTFRREELLLSDGGIGGLDWPQVEALDALPSNAPVCLVLHGLTGGSDEKCTCGVRMCVCVCVCHSLL
jgi:hypothetical protein